MSSTASHPPSRVRIDQRPATGWTLTAVQRLGRPVTEVFPFFADARNLESITPPTLRFRILTPGPIEMREGAVIDYALRVRGVPIRWRTRIPVWQPPADGGRAADGSPARFIDTQIRGPYALWRHEHTFEAPADDASATVMTDTVDYMPRGGRLLASIAHGLLVERDLRRIFEFRARVIADRFA